MQRAAKRRKLDTEQEVEEMETEVEIDDSLYSRQRYVLGDSAMQRMARSNVLVSGLGPVGVEIAKNLALAGVKSLTLHDTKLATVADLSGQFFLRETDIGKNRAAVSLPRVAELNPYVSYLSSEEPLLDAAGAAAPFLAKYECIVLTDATLAEQLAIDAASRAREPACKLVIADVYGVFSFTFVDFGTQFEVVDATGEELKEAFLSSVTQASPAAATTVEHSRHNLEDGDRVQFREVRGMTQLNEGVYRVRVLAPDKFEIDADTTGFGAYAGGGIVSQLHRRQVVDFQPLATQLRAPSLLVPDFARFGDPAQTVLAVRALHAFAAQYARRPAPWNVDDAREMIRLAAAANADSASPVEAVDEQLVTQFSYTCSGMLPAMAAAVGGWAAQEAIKGLTGKFTPLQQVLCTAATEVMPDLATGAAQCMPRGDRYDAIRVCIGDELLARIASLRLFMVGCGAIGCELLKNFALLGIATAGDGLMTITDNDLIEKSNLNRQFLFRPHHIQQPKSVTAAGSAREMNGAVRVEAHQHKVGPETTTTVYTDAFFRSQQMVVNALDNVAARLFMDGRCVANQRPLLESGTMGAKGHIQVIVPFLTESYGSKHDPPEAEIAYCTLKSFPAIIEHTIQWARDKFANLFELKPAEFNKFWETNGAPPAVLAALRSGQTSKNFARTQQIVKMLTMRPRDWPSCVTLARAKFEKYFNHKARRLLDAFPLGTTLKDGTPFWSSPKRPPTPLVFDAADPAHMDFIAAAARLLADVFRVPYTLADLDPVALAAMAAAAPVPPYRAKAGAKIVTDESVKREEAVKTQETSADDYPALADAMEAALTAAGDGISAATNPAIFEKDDDANGHIAFITATSNLRAAMYAIQPADRLRTKRIAGKIVPAIATTTAAVSGLVTVELLKVAKGCPLDQYKNCFLNLALPFLLHTEPGAAERTTLPAGQSFTLWDQWEIQGRPDMTMAQFLEAFQEKYKLEPTGVMFGSAIVYVPAYPGQQSRLTKPMRKLIKAADAPYADLLVMFESPSGPDGETSGPPVRYFFG